MYGGASQFGGEGWVTTQAGAPGGSAQKASAGQNNQSLRALTVKQIHSALNQGAEIALDGQPIFTVTVVGRIQRIVEETTVRIYHLYDGTGTIFAKVWKETDPGAGPDAAEAELREGVYVRVTGHVNRGEQGLAVFTIRPITDYNELTFHLLQSIFQHQHLAKQAPPGAATGAGTPQPAGGYGAAAAAAPAANLPGGGFDGGINPNMQAVIDIIAAMPESNSDMGVNINQVAANSGGRFSTVQVRRIIADLSDMGHAYSTVDDDHFKISM